MNIEDYYNSAFYRNVKESNIVSQPCNSPLQKVKIIGCDMDGNYQKEIVEIPKHGSAK